MGGDTVESESSGKSSSSWNPFSCIFPRSLCSRSPLRRGSRITSEEEYREEEGIPEAGRGESSLLPLNGDSSDSFSPDVSNLSAQKDIIATDHKHLQWFQDTMSFPNPNGEVAPPARFSAGGNLDMQEVVLLGLFFFDFFDLLLVFQVHFPVLV